MDDLPQEPVPQGGSREVPQGGGVQVPTFTEAMAEREARKARLASRQAVDLSDAQFVGVKDAQREDITNMEDLARLLDRYQTNLNRFLLHMQELVLESINHLEVLESHWNRLR